MPACCWFVEQPGGRGKVGTLHAQTAQVPPDPVVNILKVRCERARREVCGPVMLYVDRKHRLVVGALGFLCGPKPATNSTKVTFVNIENAVACS